MPPPLSLPQSSSQCSSAAQLLRLTRASRASDRWRRGRGPSVCQEKCGRRPDGHRQGPRKVVPGHRSRGPPKPASAAALAGVGEARGAERWHASVPHSAAPQDQPVRSPQHPTVPERSGEDLGGLPADASAGGPARARHRPWRRQERGHLHHDVRMGRSERLCPVQADVSARR
eukprot:scaffold602_cov298-Pinguiococcus_pyrenoidosus.AAC.43